MLSYDLQLFAKDGPGGEKTEQPTAKKLRDARKEGQVAKSKELGLGIGLLVMFIMLKLWVGMLGSQFMDLFRLVYGKIPEFTSMVAGQVSVRDYMIVFRETLLRILIMLLPFAGAALVAGIAIEIYQVKWRPTSKPLKPKLSKLNPISGFKKFFSLNSLIELLKAILKIGLIIWVAYSTLKNEWDSLFILYDMPIEQAIALMGDVVINLGIKISLVYLLIAVADWFYQKWKFREDMKMTKQEVKDEYKHRCRKLFLKQSRKKNRQKSRWKRQSPQSRLPPEVLCRMPSVTPVFSRATTSLPPCRIPSSRQLL